MSHLLARYLKHTLDHAAARNVERALRESVVVVVEPGSPAGRKALRGIPCIANGVTGTSDGTDPLGEVLRKEALRARRSD
jgi:hypothetical protein